MTLLEGLRVLLVDDDEDMRELLTIALEQQGMTVVSAASGTQALAELVREGVDLMLCDLSLPDMDGDVLLTRIRNEQSGPPAIAISGYRIAEPSPFDAHLMKPVEFDQLTAVMASVVERARTKRS